MGSAFNAGSVVRAVVVCLLLVGVWIPVAAVQSAPSQQATWKDYTSNEGKFIVRMPCEPSVSTGTTESDLGPVELFTTACSGDNIYCSVIYQDMPEGLKRATNDVLGRLCDGFVQGSGIREIADRRDVVVAGIPGRELEGETKDGDFRLLVRYLVVGRRIYTLIAGVSVDEPDTTRATRFVESFRLVTK